MKTKKIRLTESQLNRFIKNTARNVIKEMYGHNDVYDMFCKMRQELGDEELLDEIYNATGTDDMYQTLEYIARMHDIDLEGDSDEMY